MFEALQALGSSASNRGAQTRQSLNIVERAFPGFTTDYELSAAEQRRDIEYRKIGALLKNDGGFTEWYGGPRTTRGVWPEYREKLKAKLPPESREAAIRDVDESTTRILSRCANPRLAGSKAKGIVIGQVQSGKTANYAALIAKAVDADYRIIIVLAGMHANLRRQTQIRLSRDLAFADTNSKAGIAWIPSTGQDEDFANPNITGALRSNDNVIVAVVKKHEKRLGNVARWLESVASTSAETLERRPVLIIDDESDQATPNTLDSKQLVSTINERIRTIWKAVPTGSYVAYTATPFANIFINPEADEDLYPEDFAMVLPAPSGYMGADTFFNTSGNATEDGDTNDAVSSLARKVPDSEFEELSVRPKTIDGYAPVVTPSMADAMRWFIIATAVRRLREGHSRFHSSMLLHVSQLVRAHDRLKDVVDLFLSDLFFNLDRDEETFRALFEREIDEAHAFRDALPRPQWCEVWPVIRKVVSGVKVKIDNGASADRLVYDDVDYQTVIAIGGGTLSRGLTLEGLVVSYFLRTSNTYDTLLQMGRWFGFRKGYADLVRVWVGPGLINDYEHLAAVEAELREEIALMERKQLTPRDLGIRVLSHPGRLQITARNKMTSVRVARLGLGGSRRQTVYMDRSPQGIERNQSAAMNFVQRAVENGSPIIKGRARGGQSNIVLPGLSNFETIRFMDEYWSAPDDIALQADNLKEWLTTHGPNTEWNLVLVSGPQSSQNTFSYARGLEVNTVNRSILMPHLWSPERIVGKKPDHADLVNIRALTSEGHYLLDLKILLQNGLLSNALLDELSTADSKSIAVQQDFRASHVPSTGTVLVYAIDKDSKAPHAKAGKSRRDLDAPEHVIGVALIYPAAEREDRRTFVAVNPVELLADEDDMFADELATYMDTEGDYEPGGENG